MDNKISKQIKNIISSSELYTDFIFDDTIGVVLYDRKSETVVFANKTALNMLRVTTSKEKTSLSEFLDDNELEVISGNKSVNLVMYGQSIDVRKLKTSHEKYSWLILQDNSEQYRVRHLLKVADELNSKFRNSLNSYSEDSLMITDKDGIFRFVGKDIYETCGVSREYILNKSVYELEAEKLFYPSVSARVLREKKSQVVIQNTAKGKEVISLGIPTFDDVGELKEVISVTTDCSPLLDLGKALAKDGHLMHDKIEAPDEIEDIITCDDKMYQVESLIRLIAPTDSLVMISGETGTGKELIARSIYNLSDRRKMPFVAVNCGAVSESIIESELFGYEPGSFTGASSVGKIGLIEAANGGTLFLDEVGDLPVSQQVKLLRMLQEKTIMRVGSTEEVPVDVRVIAATNIKLEEAVAEGRFREDLYYRLNVVPINIPPLRERREDIVLLVKAFLKEYNLKHGKNKIIAKDVMQLLKDYSWPGNVRELRNTVERLVLTTREEKITSDMLPAKFTKSSKEGKSCITVNEIITISEAFEEVEKQLIGLAMKQYTTMTEIAQALDVNQSTISRKIAKYGLKV